MCVIIAEMATAANRVSNDYLVAAAKDNPHGMGITYNLHGQLFVKKDFANVDELCEFRDQIPMDDPKTRVFTHFRIATCGSKTITNQHPFLINENLAVSHNGVISCLSSYQSEYSDTYRLVEEVLKPPSIN